MIGETPPDLYTVLSRVGELKLTGRLNIAYRAAEADWQVSRQTNTGAWRVGVDKDLPAAIVKACEPDASVSWGEWLRLSDGEDDFI